MNIELKKPVYEKTEDKNRIIRYKLIKEEIFLDKLQGKIDILETRIKEEQSSPWRVETLKRLKGLQKELKEVK